MAIYLDYDGGVLIKNCPPPRDLCICKLGDGAWECYGTFTSLTCWGKHITRGNWGFVSSSHFPLSLSASCVIKHDFSASCSSCLLLSLPYHYGLPHWNISQNECFLPYVFFGQNVLLQEKVTNAMVFTICSKSIEYMVTLLCSLLILVIFILSWFFIT